LENIRFSTLKNQIEIKQKINGIPRMEVKSECHQHCCIGETAPLIMIDYKIKLLNELLLKKSKAGKSKRMNWGDRG